MLFLIAFNLQCWEAGSQVFFRGSQSREPVKKGTSSPTLVILYTIIVFSVNIFHNMTLSLPTLYSTLADYVSGDEKGNVY